MRLDATGVFLMLALAFAAKFVWHLFAASIYFIVYELTAITVFIHNKTLEWYNAKYRGTSDDSKS